MPQKKRSRTESTKKLVPEQLNFLHWHRGDLGE